GANLVADVLARDHSGEMPLDLGISHELGQDLPHRVHFAVAEVQHALGEGVGKDAGAHRVTLGVVRVEQVGRSVAVNVGGELPPEVHRVPYPRAHALGADRQVHVRGVAGKKDTPSAVFGCLTA